MESKAQIESMAKLICRGLNSPYAHLSCENCIMNGSLCEYQKSAKILANAGCSQQSDIADELIGIIEQRESTNAYLAQGVHNDFWEGYRLGCAYAYRDIKEIIQQKYKGEQK